MTGSVGFAEGRPRRLPVSLDVVVGLAVVAVALVIYWLAARDFDAGRGDFFYLADAFLHGRTWLDFRPGPNDVIISGGHFYVPFAPFPAIALMPVVAVLGAVGADQAESGINALLAAAGVGLCWMLLGRIGVRALRDRFALVVLFGFSTQILWVTTRGGVWHTGHLIATILTFICLIEVFGRRRAWLIGLAAGAAFLTRAPLAFAVPFYALLIARRPVAGVVAAALAGPVAQLDVARARRAAVDRVLLRLQPGPVRDAVRIGLRAGDPARLPRGAAGEGPVLAGARADEHRLLPVPPAVRDPEIPVPPARRPGAVRADHESRAAVRVARGLARSAGVVAARARRCSC